MKLAESKGAIFIFVYIAEAHALDEWPLRSSRYMNPSNGCAIIKKQHTNIKERSNACQKFINAYKEQFIKTDSKTCTFVLDTMNGNFSKFLKPWPARFYIMKMNHKKKLILKYVSLVEQCALDYYLFEDMINGLEYL